MCNGSPWKDLSLIRTSRMAHDETDCLSIVTSKTQIGDPYTHSAHCRYVNLYLKQSWAGRWMVPSPEVWFASEVFRKGRDIHTVCSELKILHRIFKRLRTFKCILAWYSFDAEILLDFRAPKNVWWTNSDFWWKPINPKSRPVSKDGQVSLKENGWRWH